jgi:hypothetical protein
VPTHDLAEQQGQRRHEDQGKPVVAAHKEFRGDLQRHDDQDEDEPVRRQRQKHRAQPESEQRSGEPVSASDQLPDQGRRGHRDDGRDHGPVRVPDAAGGGEAAGEDHP